MASHHNHQEEPLKETENDAIIRVIGNQQSYSCDLTIRYSNEDVNRMPSFNQMLLAPPVATLGTLQRFPTELLRCIIGNLDIQTILNFRNINRLARSQVCNLLEFQVVTTHALSCFLAVIRTGLATNHGHGDIYRAMLQQHCHLCEMPAALLYLPTLAKACGSCISVNKFEVVTLELFALAAGWSPTQLRQRMPVVRSLPGDYLASMWHVPSVKGQELRIRPKDLVDLATAREVVQKDVEVSDNSFLSWYPVLVTAHLPFFDARARRAYVPMTCNGCAVAYQSKLMMVNGVPTCLLWPSDRNDYNPDYTPSTLLAHFQNCVMAKKFWVASRGGTVLVSMEDMVRENAIQA